jgi:hypothetical protein
MLGLLLVLCCCQALVPLKLAADAANIPAAVKNDIKDQLNTLSRRCSQLLRNLVPLESFP